jgi:hypothetical protein
MHWAPDDVERREGDVKEEPHPDLDAFLVADVPVEQNRHYTLTHFSS